MRYRQGEVVLVPFPFTNLQTIKQRPAVVVSADWFNRTRVDCVLVAVTSQVPARIERDHLALSATDLMSAGLPKASIVSLGKLVTLHQSTIIKTLGTLPSATLTRVLEGVHDVCE